MKKITITLAAVLTIAIACKKEKGQKCYWSTNINNIAHYSWLDKPSATQIKKIEDSCSCSIKVDETCASCDVMLTDQGGTDIPCR